MHARPAISTLVDGLQAPCAILTARADVVHVNPMLGALLGAPPERMAGVSLGSTGDPLGKQLRPAVLHVGETGEATTIDLVGPAMGMPELPRSFHIRLVPIPGAGDDGEDLVCAIGQGARRSETESDRLLTRFEVLASAGRELMQLRDEAAVLDLVVEQCTPHLADEATVHMFGDSPPDALTAAYQRVVDEQEAILLDDLDAASANAHLGAPAGERHPTSAVLAPIRRGGRVVGVLELLMKRSARAHDETDLWIASELAARASIALDNLDLVERLEDRADAANVLTHISDGVLLVTDDGIARVWNPAAETITGLAREQVVGRPVAEAIPGWDEAHQRIPITRSPEPGGRTEQVSLEVDGRTVHIVISGSQFDDGTVYAFTDVTDERRLERLKSDFIATVSHELRTPLASIYGAGATLLRRDIDIDHEQRDDLMQLIVEQSERLASMVSDILEVSMIDAGRTRPLAERVDLRPLLQETVAHFTPLAPSSIDFRLEHASDLPAVSADTDKLRRVLLNLVENAIKYSPHGGVVRVHAAIDGDVVRVAVSDDGIGIEPAAQRRIFERFFRADPDHAEGISGTGLGLYISKELVHAMGGTIDVRSTPGEGSTFHVELPLAGD